MAACRPGGSRLGHRLHMRSGSTRTGRSPLSERSASQLRTSSQPKCGLTTTHTCRAGQLSIPAWTSGRTQAMRSRRLANFSKRRLGARGYTRGTRVHVIPHLLDLARLQTKAPPTRLSRRRGHNRLPPTTRDAATPPVRREHDRVLRRVLVPVRAVCLRPLVVRAVEPFGRAVPVPPVVVHPAQTPSDGRPVALIDGAVDWPLGAYGCRRAEVRPHARSKLVVDQPGSGLAGAIDRAAQLAPHDRGADTELGR